jgi:hypothetical protein
MGSIADTSTSLDVREHARNPPVIEAAEQDSVISTSDSREWPGTHDGAIGYLNQ